MVSYVCWYIHKFSLNLRSRRYIYCYLIRLVNLVTFPTSVTAYSNCILYALMSHTGFNNISTIQLNNVVLLLILRYMSCTVKKMPFWSNTSERCKNCVYLEILSDEKYYWLISAEKYNWNWYKLKFCQLKNIMKIDISCNFVMSRKI